MSKKQILLGLATTMNILYGGGITEYLYRTVPLQLNDNTIVVNNTEADKEVFVHNQLPSVVVNNLVHRNTETFKPFSSWDAGKWTSLYNASSQWGFTGIYDSTVSYGSSAIQSQAKQTGLFLNTFGRDLVTANSATSMQYVVGWTGDENLGANIWNTRPNEDLCVLAKMQIPYSSVTDNNHDNIKAVNQTLITYIFRINHSNKSFFYNIQLFDSREENIFKEFLMPYDGQDTSLPIIITLAHSNGESSRYAHAPDTTQTLQSFTHGTLPIGTKLYGSCISYKEMQNIIQDIKQSRPNYNFSDFKPENLRLDTVIFGPEINTNPSGNYREDGNIGMRLDEFNIYRYSNVDSTPTPTPTLIVSTDIENITPFSAQITWGVSNDPISKIEIYQNGELIETLPADSTSYFINNLTPNTQYTYKVVAYLENGTSDTKTLIFNTKVDFSWLISIYNLILQ